MGIRRRRRKLTTLMSRLDQRVRSVELKPFNLLTASQVAAAVEAGEAAASPEVLVSGTAPYEWTRIQDAYYYPAKLTGNAQDRVEIYLEADLDNLDVNGRLAVSGIHGTSNFDIDVDGDNFTVLFLDAVDGGGAWTDRASWKHDPTQDQLAGVTITNTYSFKPETLGPVTWTTRQRLQTKRRIDSFEITGTTVTLTMNAAHKFEVGDIFYTDILSDQSSNDESRVASGVDGLFYITAVTSTTIEYELTAGVDTPTGTITPATFVYVYPVARRWAQDGSIWVDSTNNETYYWNGIRWVEYTPDVSITQDDDPPSPPTSLTIASDVSLPRNVVVVDVGWTAPTTNESGSSLTDLAGHEIQWRTGPTAQWNTHFVPINLGNTYTFNSGEFAPEQLYYFQVFAVDSGDNFSSTALTGTHTTAGSSSTTNIGAIRPTPPDVETYLGTFTITWDGDVEDTSNVVQSNPPGVAFLYIHASTNASFTPSASTRVGTLAAGPNQKYVYNPQNYTDTWYFRLEIEDRAGTGSLYSRQVTATAASLFDAEKLAGMIDSANIVPNTIVSGETIVGLTVAGNLIIGNEINGNLITANSINAIQIDAGTITAKLSQGDVITTSPTDSGSRIRITKDYLEAYNNTTLNFRLTAANGHVYIGDSVQIGGDYVTTSDLSGYATTGDLAGYATTGDLNGKISVGGAAADVNAGSTTINGNAITTGTIDADLLVSDMVLSSLIKLQDSDPNLGRIELRGSGSNRGIVAFKNSGGGTANATFRLYTANGVAYLKDTYVDGDMEIQSGGTLTVNGSVSGGTFTGGTFRTGSGTFGRVNISSSSTYGYTGALNFESYNSYLRGSTNPYFRYSAALGSYATGVNTRQSLYVDNLSGKIQNTTAASDERLKEDIQNLNLGLGFIENLRPVKFVWKVDDKNREHWGFIAQEARSALEQQNVDLSNNPLTGLDYARMVDGESGKEPAYTFENNKLIPVLVQAIKDMSANIEELKARIEYLEGK